jgi:hypothetical protein
MCLLHFQLYFLSNICKQDLLEAFWECTEGKPFESLWLQVLSLEVLGLLYRQVLSLKVLGLLYSLAYCTRIISSCTWLYI